MAFKRPKLEPREAQAAPAPAGSSGGSSGGSGISTAALQAALGGAYVAPSQGSASGISTRDLGAALSSGGSSSGSKSVYSTRHTSYPLQGDLSGIPAKAGTRLGPRTTSYRIPLQRTVQQNVYDTVN